VVVLRRANNEIHIKESRDVWWHREMEYVNADCPRKKVTVIDATQRPIEVLNQIINTIATKHYSAAA
jgi:predicted kinase